MPARKDAVPGPEYPQQPAPSPSRIARRRMLLLFGVVSAGAALYLLGPNSVRTSVNGAISGHARHFDKVPGLCADTAPIPITAPRENVWANFGREEAAALREWVSTKTEIDGQLVKFTGVMAAADFDNAIQVIENFPPPKDATLAYLDGAGPEPERFAKVILNLGGLSPPRIGRYLLGPLPKTISSLSLSSPSVKLTELTHIYNNRPDVPYTARLYTLNGTYTQTFIHKILGPMEHALIDLLGSSLSDSEVGNAPPPPAGDGRLVFGASTPFSYDGSFRRMWLQLKKNVPGSYLFALDMFLYVDTTSTNPDEWYLVHLVYNSQMFKTVSSFLEAYDNGTLKRSPAPEVAKPGEEGWAARARKGDKRDLDERAGPRQVSFNGPRYRVDEKNQFVSWMSWSFYLSFARDMGMSLWNINFRGERIIYEIAPQEALAVYSGSDPHQASTVFLDGGFGMGTATRALFKGYDCPYDALYLPAITHAESGTVIRQDAICVFERDSNKPISRHTGYLKDEMGATKGYELVVRTISTVGNYDYLFDYTFQLDGSIELRVSASGYLQGAWWAESEHDYGTRIRDTYMGSLHDHVINYKVDFDIAGTANSFMAISLENEVTSFPWFEEDWGAVNQQKIVRKYVANESDALLDYPHNLEGAFLIVNKEAHNRWGNPRGYVVHPGVSAIHMTNLDNKRTEHNVNFAKQQFAVSVRKETEPSASSLWNINLPGKPPVDFFKFFDGESLDQKDLTTWINLGMHHIPRAEDSPMTLTNLATSSVLLSPFNFNDWEVSIESMNAIVYNVPEPGQQWSADEYGVEIEYCLPPPVAQNSYPGLHLFEEDGSPAKPERVHAMRQRAESYHAIFASGDL
ncbi:unnamed protein product [Mycena citricolor]|uniref:Amine oxidase n=1 Tax=Mycena citricolor TaxID=2018698 RepID=A0AAD2H2W5_9AGAR|nr:unnamed protein product [Mycena citricolor]